jgi:predicted nucleic acid-binding protein
MNLPAAAPPALVVDADVASFIINDDPVRAPRYEPHLRGRSVVIPFAAFAELLFGAEVKNWGAVRRASIAGFVRRSSIYYPDERICELWSEIRDAGRRAGRPLPQQDAWVAAIALYLDVPLVTHNARHYLGVSELQVITESDRSG